MFKTLSTEDGSKATPLRWKLNKDSSLFQSFSHYRSAVNRSISFLIFKKLVFLQNGDAPAVNCQLSTVN
ncbi:hypothetical protein [Microcoleus sp. CAWBG58]|uniref:hypothetical protein n=1 Tax=Microcoleus sp. CAWBG58 TaxID=2841651 RepID=UPI0025D53F67|nr:hypothetical protein [Microcoleus sp. CAWBG58]